jgi:hypothetical protein
VIVAASFATSTFDVGCDDGGVDGEDGDDGVDVDPEGACGLPGVVDPCGAFGAFVAPCAVPGSKGWSCATEQAAVKAKRRSEGARRWGRFMRAAKCSACAVRKARESLFSRARGLRAVRSHLRLAGARCSLGDASLKDHRARCSLRYASLKDHRAR